MINTRGDGWNFDMATAPRGRVEKVRRRVPGGREVEVERHVPEPIIVAGNDLVVTLSRWLPEEGRWSMFTKEVPPLAWRPWPRHPYAEGATG